MLMIRLARIGKKKQPSYRLVVSEKARDLYGKALEIIGHYNPRTKTAVIQKDRVTHWMQQGAQPSDTVRNLLISEGVLEGKKSPVTHISKKKQRKIKEKESKTAEKQEEKPADKPAEQNDEPKAEEKPKE